MKNNIDFKIYKGKEYKYDYAESKMKSVYQHTKLDGNEIFTRQWFQDNLGKKVKRIDTPSIDTKYRNNSSIKITNVITWQEVTVAEELYQSQFGCNMRYKLVD